MAQLMVPLLPQSEVRPVTDVLHGIPATDATAGWSTGIHPEPVLPGMDTVSRKAAPAKRCIAVDFRRSKFGNCSRLVRATCTVKR